jgi:hypothetical protein
MRNQVRHAHHQQTMPRFAHWRPEIVNEQGRPPRQCGANEPLNDGRFVSCHMATSVVP